jgi:hypothetical protein
MATGSAQPFSPVSTATIAATTTSQSAPITPADSILVNNATGGIVFVALGGVGGSPVANAATNAPVPPGSRQLFAGGPYVGSVAVIAAVAGNVYVSSGSGTAL